MITAASSKKHKALHIHYVKLSGPARDLAEWPAETAKQRLGEMFHQDERLIKFLVEEKEATCTKENTIACQSPFPNYPTSRQMYSEERFGAYVQLGYYTIINHLKDAPWEK